MANKIKSTKSTTDTLTTVAANAGIMLMTAATVLGIAELPHHPDKRAIVPTQPAFATASNVDFTGHDNQGSQLRREREETGPHYVSYSVAQRTPGRTGRI